MRFHNTLPDPKPETIFLERTGASLTQQQAANAVRVSIRTWQNWEQGITSIPTGLWEYFLCKIGRMAFTPLHAETAEEKELARQKKSVEEHEMYSSTWVEDLFAETEDDLKRVESQMTVEELERQRRLQETRERLNQAILARESKDWRG